MRSFKAWLKRVLGTADAPVTRGLAIDGLFGNVLRGRVFGDAKSCAPEVHAFEFGVSLGAASVIGSGAGCWSFDIKLPIALYDGRVHTLSIESGEAKDEAVFIGDPRLQLPNEARRRLLPGTGTSLAVAYAGEVGLRDGWILTGKLTAAADLESVTLAVFVDEAPAGQVSACMPLGGISPDGTQRLGFEYVPRLLPGDEWPHLFEFRDLEGVTVARLRTSIAQAKPYNDPASFLAWAFYHREMRAPFSDEDEICLSYFDWYATHRVRALGAKPISKVSIIMPAFNASETIARAVESVLAQTHADWELIVVDDGSDEPLGETLARLKDPRISFLRLESNQGQAESRNVALSLASGSIVAFLDADNWWDPRFLSVMAGALDANPARNMAYCGQYVREHLSEKPLAVRMGEFNPSLIENENYIDLNCVTIRKSALDRLGGFDPAFRACEDWDLILKLSAENVPLFIPVALSNYAFQRPNSVGRSGNVGDAWNRLMTAREAHSDVRSFSAKVGADVVTFWSRPRSTARAANVSIIIPSYNIAPILRLCVQRVFATVDAERTEVIICDNGSDSETQSELDRLQTIYSKLRIDRAETNGGFTVAVNRGLQMAAPGNDVVILNNDAIVTAGWLDELLGTASRNPDAAVVAPRQVLLPGTHTISNHTPFANPNYEIDVSLSAHHRNVDAGAPVRPDGSIELTFAPFFCVLVTRRALEAVGNLDERLGPHYRSDSIFCFAVRQTAGMRILYSPRAKVYHLLQRSTLALRRAERGQVWDLRVQNGVVHERAEALPWQACDARALGGVYLP